MTSPPDTDLSELQAGVEDALLGAEEIARRCGEPDLADVLARVHMLWGIGGVHYAVKLLDRARACLEALREVTDEEGLLTDPAGRE